MPLTGGASSSISWNESSPVLECETAERGVDVAESLSINDTSSRSSLANGVAIMSRSALGGRCPETCAKTFNWIFPLCLMLRSKPTIRKRCSQHRATLIAVAHCYSCSMLPPILFLDCISKCSTAGNRQRHCPPLTTKDDKRMTTNEGRQTKGKGRQMKDEGRRTNDDK